MACFDDLSDRLSERSAEPAEVFEVAKSTLRLSRCDRNDFEFGQQLGRGSFGAPWFRTSPGLPLSFFLIRSTLNTVTPVFYTFLHRFAPCSQVVFKVRRKNDGLTCVGPPSR